MDDDEPRGLGGQDENKQRSRFENYPPLRNRIKDGKWNAEKCWRWMLETVSASAFSSWLTSGKGHNLFCSGLMMCRDDNEPRR
uniref:Uncharacterized protein n=1 Tax=Steinernema glaseri TaxID=37863 RepID=A0A1I7Z0K8_9BILA